MDERGSKILSVDDEPAFHRTMNRILRREGHTLFTASSGLEALEFLKQQNIDLILLDLKMPGIDGFEVASRIKTDSRTRNIPIILITGQNTVANHVKALEIGVDDFVPKISDPAEIIARIRSHLKIKNLNDQVRTYQASMEKTVALRTQQLRSASVEVIWRLTMASEYRDNETGAHIKRMSHYSAAIARQMGLKEQTVETILQAAAMHDVGKIGIPDKILLKPGKLTHDEFEIMKQHTTLGAKILNNSKIGLVRMGAIIAATHHEKWDGSGYPKGLKGSEIPLVGRIVAVADVFDALTSERPYKKAFSVTKSHQIIKQGDGRHFDPDAIRAFFAIQPEILQIKETYQDDSGSALLCMEQMLSDGLSPQGCDSTLP